MNQAEYSIILTYKILFKYATINLNYRFNYSRHDQSIRLVIFSLTPNKKMFIIPFINFL